MMADDLPGMAAASKNREEKMNQEMMITSRTVQEITADIRLNQRNAAVSIAAIGADLIDAKAKLAHGEWMPWLESIDMAQSTADNYMRFARETRGQDWLQAMPYSKAMAILALPEETRRDFAETVDVDSKSAAEIKRLVAEVKKAKEAATAEREQGAQALAKEQARRMTAESQAETLRQQLRERPEKIIEKAVEPPDYSAIKGQVAALRERLTEAEDAAVEAEQRAAQAVNDAQQLRMRLADQDDGGHMGSSNGLSLDDLIESCNEFTRKVWAVPFMTDYFREATPEERRGYELIVQGVMSWAQQTLDAIQTATAPVMLPAEVTCDDE